jgi:transposase
MTHRYFQHALPGSPSISRLRASGVVDWNTKSVLISFGEGDDALWREVHVTHRRFPNGEALTHPYLARAWAKVGADLRVPAPGQAKKVAMLGSLDYVTRQLIIHTSPTKQSSDFVAHLEQLDRLYGPKPGQPTRPVVLVEDNGPIHTSKLSLAALAARAHWLTVEWLPKYAPQLNDIELVWRDLKAHHLAHQTFADLGALDSAIRQAVDALNLERRALPLANSRISA